MIRGKTDRFLRIVTSVVSAAVAWQGTAVAVEAGGGWGALSLPELLEEARSANPDLLAARRRWEAAQARIPQAKGLPPPRVGIEFEEIPRGTIKLNQATIMYQLIQSLPFPGKLSLKHQVAVKEAAQAGMVFKQAEWEVTSQVKTAYYDLFLLDRELEIQQEQLGWISQAVATAQARYASGLAAQAELLQSQGEQLAASNASEVLAHRREALESHLNHLVNRPITSPVGHPPPIPLAWIAFTPDELMLLAQAQQPELLAFRFSAERAEAAWRLAKRELLPDLETMVELRDPAMGPFGPWDLTLALVLPFWFWTKLKYGVRVALYDQESAQAAYQAIHNEVAKRIHEHWHEARAAYETAALCQTGLIPLRRQAVASALAAYQSGRGSFLELLDALRTLGDQERTYYRDLVSLEQHVIMLEQAAGVPLRETHALEAGGTP
jgi:outer membrane protein TolC